MRRPEGEGWQAFPCDECRGPAAWYRPGRIQGSVSWGGGLCEACRAPREDYWWPWSELIA